MTFQSMRWIAAVVTGVIAFVFVAIVVAVVSVVAIGI